MDARSHSKLNMTPELLPCPFCGQEPIYEAEAEGHACYCHHPHGYRKCPIWRNHGEHDLSKWHRNEKDGGCRYFTPHKKE